MKSKYLMIPAAVALAFGIGTATAQGTTGSTAAGPTGSATGSTGATGGAKPAVAAPKANKGDKLARSDRKFIEDAAETSMFEVQAAQLAVDKASSPEVKSYATELVKEHKAANQGLQQIANKHQVDLPKELPRGKRKTIEELTKQTGAEFDRTFVREVGVEAHEDVVKRFQKASKDIKDPELKAWADKTLPHLQEHLADARKLPQAGQDATKMGGPADNKAATKMGGPADTKAAPKDAAGAAPKNQSAPGAAKN